MAKGSSDEIYTCCLSNLFCKEVELVPGRPSFHLYEKLDTLVPVGYYNDELRKTFPKWDPLCVIVGLNR